MRKKPQFFICISILIAVTFMHPQLTQGKTFSAQKDIQDKVDELVSAYVDLEKFSGALLIAKAGQVMVQKGYGLADIGHNIPNTPDTIFRLGSVTKQFTAMLIMQCQEKGLLDVSDTLDKYIPDYPEGEKITIHHLLTHTSGIANVTDIPTFRKLLVTPLTLEESISHFKHKALEFEPGSEYKYSNSGYLLLGFILQKASGQAFSHLLQEFILAPLGMENTGVEDKRTILKNKAAGYTLYKGKVAHANYVDMGIPLSGGGMYSTVVDLYQWDRALYSEKLVKKASVIKMFTPYKGNYGYGWGISERFGHRLISHSGGIEGFTARIERYPDDNVCIIVLSNYEFADLGKLSRSLSAILFNQTYEIPKKEKSVAVPATILESYVGRYEHAEISQQYMVITSEDSRLIADIGGQMTVELSARSNTEFHIAQLDAQVRFEHDDSGQVTQMIVHIQGQKIPLLKKELPYSVT